MIFTAAGADTREKESGTGRIEDRTEAAKTESVGALIAVASPGKTATDVVGSVAARSPFFLLFNEKGELVEVLENPYRESGGGAGPLVAELLAKKGVATMVAGNFGMNIKTSLNEIGLHHLAFQGKAGDAVQAALRQSA